MKPRRMVEATEAETQIHEAPERRPLRRKIMKEIVAETAETKPKQWSKPRDMTREQLHAMVREWRKKKRAALKLKKVVECKKMPKKKAVASSSSTPAASSAPTAEMSWDSWYRDWQSRSYMQEELTSEQKILLKHMPS